MNFGNYELYAGHKGVGGSGASSDIATLRISSLAGNGNCEFSPAEFFPEEQEESPIPTANPLYEGYRFIAYALIYSE